MPPKEAPKKSKKPAVEYRDDKGNIIPFEDWMTLLRKKYMGFCKNANTTPYPPLNEKIKNCIESEDKSLVGVAF